MNIQERIEALETEFNEKIKSLKAEVQREDEFPRDGDKYWYMDINGDAVSEKWHGVDIEKDMFEIGNFFKTKEQAQFALEKLKVEAELRKHSRPFECGIFNYYIFFAMDSGFIDVNGRAYCPSQGTIYFESEEKAQQAIETVGEERIKKYIFGVE
ncbi:hypothetical protein [Aerococcus urinaeequi]|uniref:hypothetical protein n=1 Tax=Aerococcus urinaeequi TaxID=51665 RepID=UPI003D6C4FF3